MKKYIKYVKIVAFVGFVALLAAGCSDEENVKPEEKKLVSSEKLFGLTASDVNSIMSSNKKLIGDLPEVSYDINMYKVTYNTTYKNNPIVASGVVALPDSADPVAMLSWQHGTITNNDDAPSATTSLFNYSLDFFFSFVAGYGFIAVLPDYIGFGETVNIVHPYILEEPTAVAVTDLLKAAKELAAEKDLNFNEKVLLAGYSEGGYATMATHKYMEEQNVSGLNLVASFPAAGGYDVKGMQEYFFSLGSSNFNYYMAYLAYAYKTTLDLPVSLNDLFQEPYASRIPGLFNGTQEADSITNQLTPKVADLLNPDLLKNIDTASKYVYLVEALKENSLTDWAPRKKIYMYQGKDDIVVPYKNSLDVYNKLIANGASALTLTKLEGNHGGAFKPYMEDFIPKAIELK